jgi:hypothetical protein
MNREAPKSAKSAKNFSLFQTFLFFFSLKSSQGKVSNKEKVLALLALFEILQGSRFFIKSGKRNATSCQPLIKAFQDHATRILIIRATPYTNGSVNEYKALPLYYNNGKSTIQKNRKTGEAWLHKQTG